MCHPPKVLYGEELSTGNSSRDFEEDKIMRGDAINKEVLQSDFSETAETSSVRLVSRVYLASDIQRLLGLGKSKTYEFLDEVYKKQSPFRVIKVGRLYRVPKKSFDTWLDTAS